MGTTLLLSLSRRAHSFNKIAILSRIEGCSFSKGGSRVSAAHMRFQHSKCFTGPRGAVYWHSLGSSKRNSQVDSWRWSPESGVLARFRIVKRLSANGAFLSMKRNRIGAYEERVFREGLFQHR
eukprot:6688788-Pyramimonas_sp.AAC.1